MGAASKQGAGQQRDNRPDPERVDVEQFPPPGAVSGVGFAPTVSASVDSTPPPGVVGTSGFAPKWEALPEPLRNLVIAMWQDADPAYAMRWKSVFEQLTGVALYRPGRPATKRERARELVRVAKAEGRAIDAALRREIALQARCDVKTVKAAEREEEDAVARK